MLASPLGRSDIRRCTRAAQGVLLALIGAGAALALTTDRSGVAPRIDLAFELAAARAARSAGHAAVVIPPAQLDPSGISARLSMVGNRPVRPPGAGHDVGEGPAVPQPAAPAEGIRFLGVVREPDRLLALLSLNGRQRILGPGEFAALAADHLVEILQVTDDAVVLRDGRVERTIERAARTGPSVSLAATTTAAPGAAPGPDAARSFGVTTPNGGLGSVARAVPLPDAAQSDDMRRKMELLENERRGIKSAAAEEERRKLKEAGHSGEDTSQGPPNPRKD